MCAKTLNQKPSAKHKICTAIALTLMLFTQITSNLNPDVIPIKKVIHRYGQEEETNTDVESDSNMSSITSNPMEIFFD
jgi:hypothetical protein